MPVSVRVSVNVSLPSTKASSTGVMVTSTNAAPAGMSCEPVRAGV